MNSKLTAAAALLALTACHSAAPRPEPKVEAPPAPVAQPAPVAAPTVDDGFRIEYRQQAEGRTLIEVVDPAGAEVQAYDGGAQVARDKAPMSFAAAADKWYRLEVRLPSGLVREKKIAARAGQVTSIRLAVAQDAGPQPMDRGKFRALVQQVDETAGDPAKIALLKAALGYNWITAAMAGVLLDHLTYRQSKLDAVPMLRDRMLDKENGYNILDHFTYREDKEKVQQLLLQ